MAALTRENEQKSVKSAAMHHGCQQTANNTLAATDISFLALAGPAAAAVPSCLAPLLPSPAALGLAAGFFLTADVGREGPAAGGAAADPPCLDA